MILINVITLGVIVICLLIIIFIVARKFPELMRLDTATLSETKEEQVKERIIRAKLERNFLAKIKLLGKKTDWLVKKISAAGRKTFDKTLELERRYHQKLEPKNYVEKAKVDARTKDLVASGQELAGEQKFDEAERKFIDAIALDPKDREAYQGLAGLYLEQGKFEEARQTFEYILKLNSDDYDAYSHLGNIALAQGDLEKARDFHLKSIELDSRAAVHSLNLAEVYKQRQELEKAAECLNKAVGLEPNNPKNLDALLNLSIMMGNKKEAREVLNKLKEVNPENQKIKEFEKAIRKIKIINN